MPAFRSGVGVEVQPTYQFIRQVDPFARALSALCEFLADHLQRLVFKMPESMHIRRARPGYLGADAVPMRMIGPVGAGTPASGSSVTAIA